MNQRWKGARRGVPGIVSALLALLFLGGVARGTEFVGLDVNHDNDCTLEDRDMGKTWPASEVDSVRCFEVFFDGLAGLFSYGCTFCMQDSAQGHYESFTYSSPSGWTDAPIQNSRDFTVPVSDWIKVAYPDYICFVIQATDYTFSNPMTTYPYYLGSFCFRVAQEGFLGWVIDGDNAGYLNTLSASGNFGGLGETCSPYDATSTDHGKSWGEIKQLFR